MVGELATEVPEPLDQGRRYVFQLRSSVHYSDGSPLRATDVRTSLERMLVLSRGAMGPPVGDVIGANRCVQKGASCDISEGVVANDSAGTVTFDRGTIENGRGTIRLFKPKTCPLPASPKKGSK